MKLIIKDTNTYGLSNGLIHIASIESVTESRIITRSGARTFVLMIDPRTHNIYIEEEGAFGFTLVEKNEEWDEVYKFVQDKGLVRISSGDDPDHPRIQILMHQPDPRRFTKV